MCRRKKKDIGKIFETTDGIFNDRNDIKKRRPVAIVDQREDDGALALVKIHSKEGKDGKFYIESLTLMPSEHPALTEDSIVEMRIRFGKKTKEGFIPIFKGDLSETGDMLTHSELKKVKKGVAGKTKAQKEKHKKKMKKWHKHFKE